MIARRERLRCTPSSPTGRRPIHLTPTPPSPESFGSCLRPPRPKHPRLENMVPSRVRRWRLLRKERTTTTILASVTRATCRGGCRHAGASTNPFATPSPMRGLVRIADDMLNFTPHRATTVTTESACGDGAVTGWWWLTMTLTEGGRDLGVVQAATAPLQYWKVCCGERTKITMMMKVTTSPPLRAPKTAKTLRVMRPPPAEAACVGASRGIPTAPTWGGDATTVGSITGRITGSSSRGSCRWRPRRARTETGATPPRRGTVLPPTTLRRRIPCSPRRRTTRQLRPRSPPRTWLHFPGYSPPRRQR
mmetsp:Transcript_42532/g.129064  ORF Transcript_42532/g.129064 Transcript_42532/m.129064 type:complete len:306 (+) Transcript_42532:488-1405(+)